MPRTRHPGESRGLVGPGERLDPGPVIRVHESQSGHLPDPGNVPRAGPLPQRVLRLAQAPAIGRALRDEELKERIKTIYMENRSVDNRPEIQADLREQGERVRAKRVGRFVRELDIRGESRRREESGHDEARPGPDLVDRNFTAGAGLAAPTGER